MSSRMAQLSRLLDADMRPEEAEEVRAHLLSCPDCTAAYRLWARAGAVVRSRESHRRRALGRRGFALAAAAVVALALSGIVVAQGLSGSAQVERGPAGTVVFIGPAASLETLETARAGGGVALPSTLVLADWQLTGVAVGAPGKSVEARYVRSDQVQLSVHVERGAVPNALPRMTKIPTPGGAVFVSRADGTALSFASGHDLVLMRTSVSLADVEITRLVEAWRSAAR